MEQEVENLTGEITALKVELDKKTEAVEPEKVKPDLKFSCTNCDKLFSELCQMRNHAVEHQEEKANQTVKGHSMCPYCNFEFSSRVDVSDHVRVNHVKDEVCQTQESPIKSVYPCFYCEKEIMNTTDCIEKHQKDCMEPTLSFKHTTHTSYKPPPKLNSFSGPSFLLNTDFPCYTCPAIFTNKSDVRTLYDFSHPEKILFWCEVCLTNFGSDRGLKSHMRNQHKIYN